MTIAFSTKSNRWTTRYSFEPQHYFTVDQQLVSFSRADLQFTDNFIGFVQNGFAWKHDITNNYNNFYSFPYESSFTVVSNQNPSATKKFESLSIEDRNYGDWKISVEDASGAKGETASLVEKHNDFYAEIPRSNALNKGRLILIGTVRRSEFTEQKINSGVLKMNTLEPFFSKGILVYPRGINSEEGRMAVPVASEFRPFTQLNQIDEEGSDGYVRIDSSSVNGRVNTIKLDLGEGELPLFSTQKLLTETDPNIIPIFALDESSAESMSGDWLKLSFETTTSSPDIEVYAVNVDQHVVNLDHSLGQNN